MLEFLPLRRNRPPRVASRSHRYDIAVTAALLTLALLVPRAVVAAEQDPPADAGKTPSEIDLFRGAVTGSFFWGTMLVGNGSRQSYRGGASLLEVDVVKFPTER